VSPCDGKVFSFGEITHGTMLAVKGKIYSLDELLFGATDKLKNNFYVEKCAELEKNNRKLNFAILYLAPGDYH